MQKDARINLLARVARWPLARRTALLESEKPTSILYLAAASYGSRPSGGRHRPPTGFDPVAVRRSSRPSSRRACSSLLARGWRLRRRREKYVRAGGRRGMRGCGFVSANRRAHERPRRSAPRGRARSTDRSHRRRRDQEGPRARSACGIATLLARERSKDNSAVGGTCSSVQAVHCGLGPGDVDSWRSRK